MRCPYEIQSNPNCTDCRIRDRLRKDWRIGLYVSADLVIKSGLLIVNRCLLPVGRRYKVGTVVCPIGAEIPAISHQDIDYRIRAIQQAQHESGNTTNARQEPKPVSDYYDKHPWG